MATLSKHGHETHRFEHLKKRISVRSDGSVLIDTGDGWKMGKLKPGRTAEDLVASQTRLSDELPAKRPAFFEYRKAIMDEFPSFGPRCKFLAMASWLGDDLDGLWSELSDAGMEVDLDTLQEIARLKKASGDEMRRMKAEMASVKPEPELDAGL